MEDAIRELTRQLAKLSEQLEALFGDGNDSKTPRRHEMTHGKITFPDGRTETLP